MDVSMQGRACYQAEGITLDFSRWPGRKVESITIWVKDFRKGDSYVAEALIDDAPVGRSAPVVGNGDKSYRFDFAPFHHFDRPVGIRFHNVSSNATVRISKVTTRDGTTIDLE